MILSILKSLETARRYLEEAEYADKLTRMAVQEAQRSRVDSLAVSFRINFNTALAVSDSERALRNARVDSYFWAHLGHESAARWLHDLAAEELSTDAKMVCATAEQQHLVCNRMALELDRAPEQEKHERSDVVRRASELIAEGLTWKEAAERMDMPESSLRRYIRYIPASVQAQAATNLRDRGMGPFREGPDPRRHTLTPEENRRGLIAAYRKLREQGIDAVAWLWRKVRSYRRDQARSGAGMTLEQFRDWLEQHPEELERRDAQP